MDIMDDIEYGIKKRPDFVLLYGPEGVGKTTFASEAPHSVLIGAEDGSTHLNVHRFKNVNTFADVQDKIQKLRHGNHKFQSVGLDSLDWIEPLIWRAICELDGSASIDEARGGYGKGYNMALTYWEQLIASLKDLRDNRSMNIIVLAHSQVKTFNDPNALQPYDRYQLKLNDKASAKWREAVECVLFANFETVVSKDKSGKAKGLGGEVRKIYTRRCAAFDAKNRLGLPNVLPLSYQDYAQAAEKGQPDSMEQVTADIDELLVELRKTDAERAEKMVAAVAAKKGNLNEMIKIRNYARVLVGDK